jgi:hypothetical protein
MRAGENVWGDGNIYGKHCSDGFTGETMEFYTLTTWLFERQSDLNKGVKK